MCGAVALAPLALAATSLLSGKSQGVQSYSPQEQEWDISKPAPELAEPTLGVDNADANGAANKKGKASLVITRNPSVGVSGSGSGVNVTRN